MRLDRYLPEQRRRRAGSRKQKLLVLGVVLGVHVVAAAGWATWTTMQQRNAPPRLVIRYFDIAAFPPAPAAEAEADAPSATAQSAADTASAPASR